MILPSSSSSRSMAKKVHLFKGERKLVVKPSNAPDWMPKEIWKPNVKKVGIEKLDQI